MARKAATEKMTADAWCFLSCLIFFFNWNQPWPNCDELVIWSTSTGTKPVMINDLYS
jgi:hypothetical protein